MKQPETDQQAADVIIEFSKKLTASQKPVDPEIQHIVNEHWWEML